MNLGNLNQAQKEAVTSIDGPVLVVAGAGSGKTLVLTYRIAYLISQQIDASRILALTFTNKAANEMKERIRNLIGSKADYLTMGTFHSTFAKILRIEAPKISFTPSYSIYDTDDSLSLIKNILQDFDISENFINPRVVQSKISNAKNKMIKPIDYVNNFFGMNEDKVKIIYEEYQKRLLLSNAMDFDDLLLKPIELFENHNDVLKKYQNKFNYILVDEYQDTNTSQYYLLKLLSDGSKNICVVGDDAQSIYKWRGADIRNILDFTRDFSNAKLVRLEQNYRSTKSILGVAGSVIRRNANQIEKNLWTQNPVGEKVEIRECIDDRDEANYICKEITIRMISKKYSPKDFAILYRTNAQSRSFEESLIRGTIPYSIVGGVEFYKRKEVKDVLAYLRLLINPKDNESFLRIINFPSRGIGDISISHLKKVANDKNLSLFEAIDFIREYEGINDQIKKNFISFRDMIQKYKAVIEKFSLSEFVRSIIDEIGILKIFKEENTEDSLNRYENIIQLINAVQEFSKSNPHKTLVDFLNDVTLISEIDNWADKANSVTLMTLHSAKGLEFKNVFITGCEEGLLPLTRDSNTDDLEEERRLFYVGCTRAKESLCVSFARNRNRFGNLYPQTRSRFIDEIDDNFVEYGSTQLLKFSVKRKKIREIVSGEPKISHPHMPSYEDYSQENKILTIGSKVQHDVFGNGVVRQLSGFGDSMKAVVEFEEGFQKHLMLKFAKLKLL